MDKLVTIASFDLADEAEVVKLLLEEAGFHVFLADNNLVRTNWFLSNAVGGAKLQVLESQAEEAAGFVEEHRQRGREKIDQDASDVTFNCEECGQPLTLRGDRRGKVETCPHCHEYIDVPE